MWHREHEEDRNRDGVQRRQPVLLAEYASVSNEIHRRSDAQQPLIALTITALATITGIVVGKSSARGLILLLPLVSSTCGLLWLDHALTIRKKGRYIGEVVRPLIVDVLPDSENLLQNEALTRAEERNVPALALAVTPIVFFAVASLAAVGVGLDVLVGHHRPSFGDDVMRDLAWAGWGIGLLLTLGYSAGCFLYVRDAARSA